MFHIFYATPPSSNLFTQMASMPKWQNHSSYLVLCFACYYSYHCIAARQKPNMIVMKANCSVMFPDGMKWTCIQETNTHPINMHLSDDWHQHTHTHPGTALMGYLPIIKQCLAGFYGRPLEGGGGGEEDSAAGQTTGCMHTTALTVMQFSVPRSSIQIT